jgi:hypothetical protein
VGRVLFATIDRWVAVGTTYHVLPPVLAGTFVVIAFLPHDSTAAGVAAFAVAGLGCSDMRLLTVYALSAIIAVGMGLASFGVTRAGRVAESSFRGLGFDQCRRAAMTTN